MKQALKVKKEMALGDKRVETRELRLMRIEDKALRKALEYAPQMPVYKRPYVLVEAAV